MVVHSAILYRLDVMNLGFVFLSPESAEVFDEIAHASSKGIAEGAILSKKHGQDREKIADSERIKPKVQVMNWQVFSYRLPLISGGIREGLILRLIDSDGKEKWGEIAPYPGRSGETFSQARDQLLKVVSTGRIDETLFPSVQFGLESALSFSALQTQAPLYALLEGKPEEVLHQANVAFEEGYKTVKVKVSSFKIEAAADLLGALKDRFRLRIDCNRAFSFEEAISLFSKFEENTFDYIEDPTFETSRLADFPFPFALDEAVSDAFNLPLKTYENLYGFILKPTLLGGKKGCAPLVAYAQKNNLKVVFSSTFESGLGLLQILSLASHFNLLTEPLGLDTHRRLTQDLLSSSANFNTPLLNTIGVPKINMHMLKEIAN